MHGSSSPCIKLAVRDRIISRAIVTDVVRSDSGIVAYSHQALSGPLGSISSDMFRRCIRGVLVLERAGGWQDDKTDLYYTFLYVFDCKSLEARSTHRFDAKFLQLDTPILGQVFVNPPTSNSDMVEIIVDAKGDLAYITQLQKEGTIRVHIMQKSMHRFRWALSADKNIKHAVVDNLRAKRADTFENQLECSAMAVPYLQQDIFVDIVDEISKNIGGNINITRHVPKWMILKGSQTAVENALKCCQVVLRNRYEKFELSGRVVTLISQGTDVGVSERSPLKVSAKCLFANLVQVRANVASWVDESVVQSFICAVQITPAQCILQKGAEGATVTVSISSTDAKKPGGAQFDMP